MTRFRSASFARLALVPALGLALAGLGLAVAEGLRARPAPDPVPLAQPAGSAPASAPRAPWPALFGTEDIATAPEPAAPSEPDEEPYVDIDTSLYVLRGVLGDGDGGGMAVIETPAGVVFARPGDPLEGGVVVGEILEAGVELLLDDLAAVLEFDAAARTPWIGPPEGALYATPPGSLDVPSYPSYTPGETDSGAEPEGESAPPPNRFGISR